MELLFPLLMFQSVPFIELSLDGADVAKKKPVDQLDHMECIDDGNGIREVFIYIIQIWPIHIRDEILDPSPFFSRDLCELGKGVFFSAADDKIDRFACDEIL